MQPEAVIYLCYSGQGVRDAVGTMIPAPALLVVAIYLCFSGQEVKTISGIVIHALVPLLVAI